MCMLNCSCSLACLDALTRACFCIAPELEPAALLPLFSVLGLRTLMPSWPWWSACVDALARAGFCIALELARPALLPLSSVLGSRTLMPSWPWWSACLDALAPACFCIALEFEPAAPLPQQYYRFPNEPVQSSWRLEYSQQEGLF